MSTFLQLQTAVAGRIGMNITDDATNLKAWINDGVREISVETAVNVDLASLPLTSGEGDYTWSTQILRVLHAYHVGTESRTLRQIELADLFARRMSEPSIGGSASIFAIRGRSIFLYPTPGANETLNIVYVPRPAELSANGDDPSAIGFGGIPVEFHPCIEAYACVRAADFDDDMSSQMGSKYQADYGRELMRMKRALRRMGGLKAPRKTVGFRSRFVSSDNSRT